MQKVGLLKNITELLIIEINCKKKIQIEQNCKIDYEN